VRKRLKISGNSAKRFLRLPLTTIVIATAILAIGAITVISRQKAARVKEESNNQESRSLVSNSANKNYVTVKVAGQDVQVDSQTGQLKELTPEETKKLAAGLKQVINQSNDGLVEVQHADGSVSVDLDGRFQNVTVARINEDGSLSESCVDNAQAAGEFFGIDPQLIENPSSESKAVKQPVRNMPARNLDK
jgi:hypothetical protein